MRGRSLTKSLVIIAVALVLPLQSAYAIDAMEIMINLSNQIGPFQKLVTGFAYVMGIGLIVKGIYILKVYGEARTMMSSQTSLRAPLTYLIVGAVFIYFPSAVDVMMVTTFGQTSILAYPGADKSLFATTTRTILRIIQFIGLVSFIRGWLFLSQSGAQGHQPGLFGKALTHIIGGAIAMNIVLFIDIMGNTLGVDFGF